MFGLHLGQAGHIRDFCVLRWDRKVKLRVVFACVIVHIVYQSVPIHYDSLGIFVSTYFKTDYKTGESIHDEFESILLMSHLSLI